MKHLNDKLTYENSPCEIIGTSETMILFEISESMLDKFEFTDKSDSRITYEN